MTELEDVGRLQIEQDERFQRLSWRVQRICWAVMAVIILLALLGAFGDGPLANAHAGTSQDPLYIRYERIVRRKSSSTIQLDIRSAATADGMARVEKLVDDLPMVLIEKGKLRWDRMNPERVDEADVLNAARSTHGLGELKEIDYAVLEHSGMITILPKGSRKS